MRPFPPQYNSQHSEVSTPPRAEFVALKLTKLPTHHRDRSDNLSPASTGKPLQTVFNVHGRATTRMSD
ncbi:hypothetical protein K0M31_005713 [Melipona bicolor]|uniref:Uncharacterized protein n=1 Tax=Melipona bicolor TaxID=60889 RepID=A0AA40FU58_9HYME|nr:hypothetical protein K0M31_005713 [Melipona bicolor]